MRCITKAVQPDLLRDNAPKWLADFLADPESKTKRYRYRSKEIKEALKAETNNKCIYCESRIGHNTPGDVEHKVPTSREPQRHFDWLNLSIACGECNRRKNDYYRQHDGFLDPYIDNVDDYLEHHGPVVAWRTGSERGEICVNTLELCSPARASLVLQKVRVMRDLNNLLERYNAAHPGALRELLRRQIAEMAGPDGEYSAMVRSALTAKGYAADLP